MIDTSRGHKLIHKALQLLQTIRLLGQRRLSRLKLCKDSLRLRHRRQKRVSSSSEAVVVVVGDGVEGALVVVVRSVEQVVSKGMVVVRDKEHGTNIAQRSALFVCPVPTPFSIFPQFSLYCPSEPKPGPKLGSICVQY